MINTILIIAGILILAILFLIFRIQTLVNIMRGSHQKRVGASNRVNAFLLPTVFVLGIIGFIWSYLHSKQYFLPDAVSAHGIRTDRMFWITMGILCFGFIVTNIFLFFFAWKYQYREDRKAFFYPDNHKLEIIWTVIPAIVMAILVFYGWVEWREITKQAPANAEELEIMGKQFAWQVRYPGKDGKLGKYEFLEINDVNEFGMDLKDPNSWDDFMPKEIHIPKGKEILLRIRARDVLHSVYAPHFRLKMDAVPGMPTKFHFRPLKTTREMRDDLANPSFNYEIACTEICGKGHYAMRFVIVVEEEEEYKKWKASQKSWAELNREFAIAKNPKIKSVLPVEEKPATTAPSDTTKTGAATQAAGDTASMAQANGATAVSTKQ